MSVRWLCLVLYAMGLQIGQAKEWTDQWAVKVLGGSDVADRVARESGFQNLGIVRFVLSNNISISDWEWLLSFPENMWN
jgi:hypothetical protein